MWLITIEFSTPLSTGYKYLNEGNTWFQRIKYENSSKQSIVFAFFIIKQLGDNAPIGLFCDKATLFMALSFIFNFSKKRAKQNSVFL